MRSGFFLFLLLVLTPLTARAADVFEKASAYWGIADFDDMTCESNPHRIAFNATRTDAFFQWRNPVHNSDGSIVEAVEYRVLSAKTNRLTLQRKSDARRFSLILAEDGRSYRFGSTEDPEASYYGVYMRCVSATS